MKTAELQGKALDWAVAKCEGLMQGQIAIDGCAQGFFSPSTDWASGAWLIIEREGITVSVTDQKSYINQDKWVAYRISTLFTDEGEHEYMHGPTPLIAAMRCYVAIKLGDEVEIPEELI
jgi:hypothetical protein